MKHIEKATDLLSMIDEDNLLHDKVDEFGSLDLSERESEAVSYNLSLATNQWMVLKGRLERAEQRIKELEKEI